MYQVGQWIIYGGEGACQVEAIGPLAMRGANREKLYYTLAPAYRSGKVYAPVDGQVFSRPILSRDEAEALVRAIPGMKPDVCREKNLRLVYVFEHSNGEFPSVNVDNFAAARLAVRHLAEMGHRRIGLFCVPHRRYHYVNERHDGFLAGMAEAGLEANPEWIVCTDERENAVAKMLSLPERNRPTALFGISDFLLLHVQRYAFLHGIRIPEDLSLVGMGNMEAGNFAVVPLTSIEEDHREFGKVAVRALLDKETGVKKQGSGMYLLPPRLIRRVSSAPPRKRTAEERSLS